MRLPGMDTATVEADGRRVSSTLVRAVVERGDFARAAELLGRPFSISGVVGYGQQLPGVGFSHR